MDSTCPLAFKNKWITFIFGILARGAECRRIANTDQNDRFNPNQQCAPASLPVGFQDAVSELLRRFKIFAILRIGSSAAWAIGAFRGWPALSHFEA
jgi:hypothetical protein